MKQGSVLKLKDGLKIEKCGFPFLEPSTQVTVDTMMVSVMWFDADQELQRITLNADAFDEVEEVKS